MFQLEAADKKLRNSNKFLEQQITEWDFERDRSIVTLPGKILFPVPLLLRPFL